MSPWAPPTELVDRRHRLCWQRGDFLAGLRHERRSLDSGRRKKPGGGLEGDAGLLDLQGPTDQGSGDAGAVFREGRNQSRGWTGPGRELGEAGSPGETFG